MKIDIQKLENTRWINTEFIKEVVEVFTKYYAENFKISDKDVICNEEFYSDLEINQYLTEKLEVDTVKFPIRLKCLQVSDDQWIGAADTNFFMKLRRAQLIRYNANAQRVMKRIIKGESVLFKLVPLHYLKYLLRIIGFRI